LHDAIEAATDQWNRVSSGSISGPLTYRFSGLSSIIVSFIDPRNIHNTMLPQALARMNRPYV
jgi:hypothetical protein